jgi:hypothetical protein
VNPASKYLVIDGSNIATEGRTTPSLAQLEGAVDEIRKEMHDTEITVVVDATFAHRIDPGELPRFEAAALRGEYVSPPAGAIGRGDAFLLRIAEKVNATVLSNDSFQEFHGEHQWLFEPGRLLGATPVPGIGWIFVPRTPVRGPKSRVAVRDATRAKTKLVQAVAAATAEATGDDVTPEGPRRRSRRRSAPEAQSEPSTPDVVAARRPEAVNAPMPFISFIAQHPLGASVDGLVDSFTSHGAVILVGDVRCYVPLSGLGSPAPRSAREVLAKGTRQEFVVIALDPARRGIELALPAVGIVRGVPSEETVAAEVEMIRPPRRRRSVEPPIDVLKAVQPSRRRPVEAELVPLGVAAKKSAAKKPTPSKTPAASEPATRQSASKRSASAKSAPSTAQAVAPAPTRGRTKRAPEKRVAAKAAVAIERPAKKVAAKRAAASVPAPKSPARKTSAATLSTPAQSAAPRKAQGAKKAPVTKQASPVKTIASSADGPRRSGRTRA